MTVDIAQVVEADLFPGVPKVATPKGDTFEFGLEDVVPPTHDHRTLVLCFDGTGEKAYVIRVVSLAE